MEITIIVPVKNRRKYLDKTLSTITSSSVAPREIILVDNGSTDGSYEFCMDFTTKRDNAKLLRQDKQGASAARNKGLEECQTEWVHFFDSDDEYDSDFIDTISKKDVSQYDMIVVPTKMRLSNGAIRIRDFIASGNPATQILGNVLNTQGMVFRTDFLKRIGGWNEDCMIWNDWELGLRALLNKPRVLWIEDKAFHTINLHEDSITGSSYSSRYASIISTLNIAKREIESMEKDMVYPLFLRTNIFIGKIQSEQKDESEAATMAMKDFMANAFDFGGIKSIIGNLLRTYSKHGGRGAWRIALKLC
ncbi:MAG: glycosyltransferase family 2 protein [Bacteroidaceae bacterium]|nr:glycosyltransferase family 2 protein [Bacteroidaceae bacterium]